MNRVVLAAALLLCSTSIAAAQTEGRVSVGASVTYVNPTTDGMDSVVGIGPLVRLNPRRGWGPAGAFNWFRADVRNPSGADGDFARLRVRPLMAGVAYSVGSGNVLTSFSLVAGPSFNSIDFEDAYLASLPQGSATPAIDIENNIAFRPGVNVTVTVAPRVAIVGFGGYLFSRPDTFYRDHTGAEFRNQWKADSFVVSAGVVYSLF
jgi:hypothetical protein